MLSWIRGGNMELEMVVSLCRAEMLRGIITEKLTTAAREIFAVVERTVAGYEEEASGFRQEIDRQRRQLEVVLQPEIKVETTDDEQLFAVCESAPEEVSGRGGRELSEDEEQHKYEPSVSSICNTEDEYDEGVDEQPVLSPTQDRERPTELDCETAIRLSPPSVNTDRKSTGRRRIAKPQNHIDLRIRILEDSQIEVLSISVFKKYPVHELHCPRGLQEADFLNLLRSTYPQLATDKPFDIFMTDQSRRLQPLKVMTMTPEEIYSSLRSRGAGNSALYIRLKTQAEPQATDEHFDTSQREAAAAAPAASSASSSDQTRPRTRVLSTTVPSANRKRGRPRNTEPQTHIDLRIRILEDSELDVLTVSVFKQYPVHELQCPCGLQEADFLNLLRSTYPQLAADKPFDIFTLDKNKRLQSLRVKAMIPEELVKCIGHSALYIRLKAPEELGAREKPLHPLQRKYVSAAEDSPSTSDQTRLNSSVQSYRRKPGRPQISAQQNHIDLRIRILEDPQIDVLTSKVFKKYPAQELQCPRGLQEADFVDLLKSTFPQLAADKPFDLFTTDRSKRLYPLKVNPLTAEEIHRIFVASRHSTLFIQLKAHKEAKVCVDNLLQRTVDTAKYFPSTSDQTRLHNSIRVQQRESKSQREDTDTEEKEDIDHESVSLWSLQSVLPSESDKDGDEANDRDYDSNDAGLRNSESEKMRKRQRTESSNIKTIRSKEMQSALKVSTENGDAPLYCKVCKIQRGSMKMLVKHAWSHVDDPRRLCGVCGEHSEELRSHLQSHLKTHSCDFCGKSFLSIAGLKGHTARHKGEKPVNKPLKCDICQKVCVSQMSLKLHTAAHSDKPHTSRKSFRGLKTLSQHMAGHSSHTEVRERMYACKICSRHFYTNEKLQFHFHSAHTRERPYISTKCNKQFLGKTDLDIHMRAHTGQMPYKCSVCDKGYSQNHCLIRHMKTHQLEENSSLDGSD